MENEISFVENIMKGSRDRPRDMHGLITRVLYIEPFYAQFRFQAEYLPHWARGRVAGDGGPEYLWRINLIVLYSILCGQEDQIPTVDPVDKGTYKEKVVQ